MFSVSFRTNLDVEGEVWPSVLEALPEIGSTVRSARAHGQDDVQIELTVVGIKLVPRGYVPHMPSRADRTGDWLYEIELNLPPRPWAHVQHWTDWYDLIRGKLSRESYTRRTEQYHKDLFWCEYGTRPAKELNIAARRADDRQSFERIRMRASECGDSAMQLHVQGYGDADHDTAVVTLSATKDGPVLHVWADSSTNEPTHVITFEKAKRKE